ncbi:MAG TPA: hypothetical protein VGT03_05720 [Candidatus Acidoferrales bacterium]|nr:hypothetical protein [Candidatus Acidoferrales bacterium]
MKDIAKSYLSAALGLLLVGGVWALPATRAHREAKQAAIQAQDQQKSLEATGKIASVTESDFTLEVQKPDGTVDPMTFMTDKDSVLNGKLVEGATADVTYRVEKGKNIVVSAHITPPPKSGS